MRARTSLPLPPAFESVDDVIDGLTALERALVAARDRRGVFVAAYLASAQTLGEWIERGRFLERDDVVRYVIAFANAYRHALAGYEAGQRSAVPTAWLQSFDAARSLRASVVQHLLLGVNAHINRDLPHAAIDSGLSVGCERSHHDYTLIDDAMRDATPRVLRRVAAKYQLTLHVTNWMFRRTADEAVSVSFRRAREHAWAWATALATADPGAPRHAISARINHRAALAGAIILRCRFAPTRGLAILHEVEALVPCPRPGDPAPPPLADAAWPSRARRGTPSRFAGWLRARA
jgi:Family of unknown function (DUF5995)